MRTKTSIKLMIYTSIQVWHFSTSTHYTKVLDATHGSLRLNPPLRKATVVLILLGKTMLAIKLTVFQVFG